MVHYTKADYEEMERQGYNPGDNWDIMRYEFHKENMEFLILMEKNLKELLEESSKSKSKSFNNIGR